MQSLSRVSLALTASFLVMLISAPAASAQRWNELERAIEGRQLTLRPTIEGRRKVYIDTGADAEVFALHRGDRLFPLRVAEPVRILDADPERDHIELELQSARLGRGRIDFYGRPPAPEEFERWLDEVFEVVTPAADFHRYVANRRSRTLHIRGANHLPPAPDRELFADDRDALDAGYSRCGVCFLPTPDVAGYETEKSLAMFGLQQVRATYYPSVDTAQQQRVAAVGTGVLDRWPVPLKGYRYRFQVVDADDINAFAVPTRYIFVTRGLLESLETDEELAAILAHEIAHVESRHSYRQWRNERNTSIVTGILGALAGVTDNAVDDVIAAMTSFTSQLFLAGHGRDREREADLFASFYLNHADISDRPLLNAFRKLQFARDAYDPFGDGGGLFASHPHIGERIEKSRATVTAGFAEDEVFQGVDDDGRLVATLRFDVQRLFRSELDVVATLSTTAELGEEDNVNTLSVWVASATSGSRARQASGQRIRLRERTAEKIFPSDDVSAVFGNDDARGLIERIERVDLNLRNVDRWRRAISDVESR